MDTQAIIATGAVVLGGLAAYHYMNSSNITPKTPEIQAVEIGRDKPEGETPIYRHVNSLDKLADSLGNGTVHDMKELVLYCAKRFSTQEYIGSRVLNANGTRGPFKFISYQETYERSVNLAKGLAAIGASGGDRIGFYSSNCVEWRIAELACYLHNLIVVSLYDSLGPGAVKYIVSHSETNIVFCSASVIGKLIEAIEPLESNPIKHIVLLFNSNSAHNSFDESLLQKLAAMKIQTHKFDELIELGKANPTVKLADPQPDDLATIMYTSGTTGEPKGVMITHRNFISVLAGFLTLENSDMYLEDGGSEARHNNELKYLSYLPLAHIMERVGLHSIAYFGGTIGFYSGDIKNLVADFTALKPHYVVGAPRIYQKIAGGIKAEVEKGGALKQWLFQKAYEDKKKALQEGRTTPFWDKLIFNKIRDSIFGPNVNRMTSGSAPLGEALHDFLRIVFSVNVTEGYGLTETTAGCCYQSVKCMTPGRVGPPVGSCEIKLVDVPEMGYTSKDQPCPRGEICLRGPSVFVGYYKNPQKTKEVIDENGWFHTEDIGRLNEDNTFSIIDRKKNLFKLSFGEYVAPEFLEAVYGRSSFVAQCFVYGDSFESSLVGVIVPDAEVAKVWFAKNSALFPNQQFDFATVCKSPEFKKEILNDLTRVGKEAKLLSYELLKDIHLEHELWTLQNNILTATYKLKRRECKAKYEKEIMDMYLKINGQLK